MFRPGAALPAHLKCGDTNADQHAASDAYSAADHRSALPCFEVARSLSQLTNGIRIRISGPRGGIGGTLFLLNDDPRRDETHHAAKDRTRENDHDISHGSPFAR
jgi:hypothetical protein